MARFNLFLSDTQDALLDDLKKLCDLGSKKDVVENALMLLGWAATEAAKGLSIASIDESRRVFREVETPALQGARKRAEILRKMAAAQPAAAAAQPAAKGTAEPSGRTSPPARVEKPKEESAQPKSSKQKAAFG